MQPKSEKERSEKEKTGEEKKSGERRAGEKEAEGNGAERKELGRESPAAEEDSRVSYVKVRNCFEPADRPDLVVQEMKDASKASGLVEKPVYHLIIGWPPEDGTTQEERIEATEEVLTDIGLADRQALIVEHDDENHHHVHVMANRVQHDPYAEDYGTAWETGHDWQETEASLRRIEKERGWRQVPGRMAETPGLDVDRKQVGRNGYTFGQMKYQERTGELPRVAQFRAQVTMHFEEAGGWDELCRPLRSKKFEIEEKGAGGVLRDLETGEAVKLSSIGEDFSLGKLESRFDETYAEYLDCREKGREEADRSEQVDRSGRADRPEREEPGRHKQPSQEQSGQEQPGREHPGREQLGQGGGADGTSEKARAEDEGHGRELGGDQGSGQRPAGRDRAPDGQLGAGPEEAEPIASETGEDPGPAAEGDRPDEEAKRDADAEGGRLGSNRGAQKRDAGDRGDDAENGPAPGGHSSGREHRGGTAGPQPLAPRGRDLIAASREANPQVDLSPGEEITGQMSENEQKRRARKWVRLELRSRGARSSPGLVEAVQTEEAQTEEAQTEKVQMEEAQQSSEHGLIEKEILRGEEILREEEIFGEEKTSEEETPDQTEILGRVPTPQLKDLRKRIKRRERKVEKVIGELEEVREETGGNLVGLRRRREATGKQKATAETLVSRADAELARRTEEEQKLRKALETIEKIGDQPYCTRGQEKSQEERKMSIEKACALLKASRLRSSIRGAFGEDAPDAETVEIRMEAAGLQGPIEELKSWGPNSRPDVGRGGEAVMEAARGIDEAVEPEYRIVGPTSLYRESGREKAKEALQRLSEEERRQVRGELAQRGRGRQGEKTLQRIEREMESRRKVKEAREALEKLLGRARQTGRARQGEKVSAAQKISRAEVLDRAKERFQNLEEADQRQVRQELSEEEERQLKEALEPDRPSAEEIRARRQKEVEEIAEAIKTRLQAGRRQKARHLLTQAQEERGKATYKEIREKLTSSEREHILEARLQVKREQASTQERFEKLGGDQKRAALAIQKGSHYESEERSGRSEEMISEAKGALEGMPVGKKRQVKEALPEASEEAFEKARRTAERAEEKKRQRGPSRNRGGGQVR